MLRGLLERTSGPPGGQTASLPTRGGGKEIGSVDAVTQEISKPAVRMRAYLHISQDLRPWYKTSYEKKPKVIPYVPIDRFHICKVFPHISEPR